MASRKDPLRAVQEARDALEAARAAYEASLFHARAEGHTVRRIAKAARVTPQEISRRTFTRSAPAPMR